MLVWIWIGFGFKIFISEHLCWIYQSFLIYATATHKVESHGEGIAPKAVAAHAPSRRQSCVLTESKHWLLSTIIAAYKFIVSKIAVSHQARARSVMGNRTQYATDPLSPFFSVKTNIQRSCNTEVADISVKIDEMTIAFGCMPSLLAAAQALGHSPITQITSPTLLLGVNNRACIAPAE